MIYSPEVSSGPSDSGGVSGPGDSGSRSTSGDTGEGELTIRVEGKVHTTRHIDVPCIFNTILLYYNLASEASLSSG